MGAHVIYVFNLHTVIYVCALTLLLWMSGFVRYMLHWGVFFTHIFCWFIDQPTLELPLKHVSLFWMFWIPPVTAEKIKSYLTENMKDVDPNLVQNPVWKWPQKYKEKVTTLVWPLHTGQISHDICWTATYLALQMKMETRMMDVNRLYQSLAIDHSLPKRNGGDFGTLTEVAMATWPFGQNDADNFFLGFLLKAGKYQTNQVFELHLTHRV